MMDAFQAHLARIALETVGNRGFVLGGGHAVQLHGMAERPSEDIDLFSADRGRPAEVEADVVCVGHTHQPYVLEVGDKLVINPGSVGQPRDGDPRAAYAIIEDNRVELKRVEYPTEDAVRVVQDSSLPDDAKEMLADIFRNGKNGKQGTAST